MQTTYADVGAGIWDGQILFVGPSDSDHLTFF